MYISKIQVFNYKNYHESDEIELKPCFNIVVGQNSAGKTALLEAMSLQFNANPHRSLKTVPFPGTAASNQFSSVLVAFVLTREELLSSVRHQFYVPPPAEHFRNPEFGEYNRERAQEFLTWFFSHSELQVTARFEKQPGGESWVPEDNRFGLYPPSPIDANTRNRMFLSVRFEADGKPRLTGVTQTNAAHDVIAYLASALKNRIYRFHAERFNFGDSPTGTNRVLSPNAANLPEVLDLLNENTARMKRFNDLVHEILPQVQHVSISKIPPGGQFSTVATRILVWAHDYASEKVHLAVPLNECGSGVGQVLAILYVVMNSDESRIILIDEPQSFLHPGAVRKLIEVLKRFPQHQYVLATHSPALITAAEPATLTVARTNEGQSKLEAINPSNADHTRAYLAEIGARLSDVFGADHILWVEGETEEACFPLLLRLIAKQRNVQVSGIAVVGIRQTGDLQGRDKEKILRIYRRLSEAKTLLPPTIAFVFDEECLTEQKKADLKGMGHGLIHFLPRRMYENYLLDPESIAAVANGCEGFREQPVTAEEVGNFLNQKRGEWDVVSQRFRYFCKGVAKIPQDWERTIAADRLLEDIFRELSENRVEYEKTTHSVAISTWLIEHKPEALNEVVEMLVELISPQSAVHP